MAGLGRVHKHGRRAGGSQGGHDLAPDVSAFTHPHHHHTSPGVQHHFDRLRKSVAHPAFESENRSRLNVECFMGQCDRALCGRGFAGAGVRGHRQIL